MRSNANLCSLVRLHVGLDGGQLLEPVEERDQLGVLGNDGLVQDAVLVEQLVHDEVHEADVVAREPGTGAQEILELLQLGREGLQVAGLQLLLYKYVKYTYIHRSNHYANNVLVLLRIGGCRQA